MAERNVRRLAAAIAALFSLQVSALLHLPDPGSRAEAQELYPVTAPPPTAVVTTTTAPPPHPVFSEGYANPFPAGNRPPAAEVQAAFGAPLVDSPDDLVRFQPAYELIQQLALARWGESEWLALELLLMHESRFDPRAVHPDTGACGIFQALECGKMERIDWRGQIDWGLSYIEANYGLPSAAWAFWLSKAHPCSGANPYGFVACNGWY